MMKERSDGGVGKSPTGKFLCAAALLCVAAYYGWARYQDLNPSGINNGNTSEIRMPAAAERKRLEAEFVTATGLAPETVEKLRVAFENNPREAMTLAATVLNDDQKVSAGLFMMARMGERDKRLSKMLSESDMTALKDRRSQSGGRRWWGRGRGAGLQ